MLFRSIAAALEKSGGGEVIRRKAGLPPATYFSAGKLQWLLEDDGRLRADAERGEALFGTIDCWLLWNMTGGTAGGVHVTDVTNASRTMLMDLRTLDWHEPSLELIGVPRSMLPEIRSSSEHYGAVRGTALFVTIVALIDRKSTRLNSSHAITSRMPSSA